MNTPRFLQIHTLHSYTATLLNRDDTGQAKRLIYGDTSRTRISSQCLKRHWRMAENDPNALQKLEGGVDSYRSRELVTEKVIKPLAEAYPEDVVKKLDAAFQKFVYGEKADKGKKSRQTLLLGAPELDWLAERAKEIAKAANGDPAAAEKDVSKWMKDKNFRALAEGVAVKAGLAAALFGRMVTSDPAANIDAPVYVAHAFTVHPAETEFDYFTAVDDLKRDDDDSGADTVQETELTCGLFYGYVVIDMPGLISNLSDDRDLAERVIGSLVHLIAEVSPGAKLGSTAPFGRADLMLIEAGDRQPRSLATAFRKALRNDDTEAVAALGKELALFDENYATGEMRKHLSMRGGEMPGSERVALDSLATWAGARVQDAPDA